MLAKLTHTAQKLFLIFLFVFGFLFSVNSQRPKVIYYIEKTSKVKIHQDPSIDNIINKYLSSKDNDSNQPRIKYRYRVQVFSSNNQRRAKQESQQIKQMITNTYPGTGVYRMFSSPFWKVRVGNFGSREEAQAFRNKLVRRFPQLRAKSYVVRER